MKIDNWSIVTTSSMYSAPECITYKLHGLIYDDEKGRFNNGDPVTTSRLVKLSIKDKIAETNNNKYTLGEPSKNYLEYLKSINKALSEVSIKD